MDRPPLPEDLRDAASALDEARGFASREGARRGGLCAVAAGLALVLVAAAALLHLGLFAVLPVLALGPVQSSLLRWFGWDARDARLPPALHVVVAAAAVALLVVAGVLRNRTDLLPAASIAGVGALVVLQGVRARDRWALAIGGAAVAAGGASPFLPAEALNGVVGGGLVLAAGLIALGLARFRTTTGAHATP